MFSWLEKKHCTNIILINPLYALFKTTFFKSSDDGCTIHLIDLFKGRRYKKILMKICQSYWLMLYPRILPFVEVCGHHCFHFSCYRPKAAYLSHVIVPNIVRAQHHTPRPERTTTIGDGCRPSFFNHAVIISVAASSKPSPKTTVDLRV